MKTDGRGFLRRWSERKQAARIEAPTPSTSAPEAPPEIVEPATEPFDPATLPSIESLGASSDYTAFLRPEVPQELVKAALRQAWLSDPVISTFREMADYDWDFNAPGYGALLPTDDVQAMLNRVINRPEPEPEPAPAPEPAIDEQAVADVEPTNIFVAPPVEDMSQGGAPEPVIAAAQHDPNPADLHTNAESSMLRRPRHGGALPV